MIILQRRAVVDEYRQFSFNRNSVAFGSNGRLYYPHQARFETVSGRTGVLIEEGTTNAAVIRSDLRGLAIGASLERDSRRYTRLDEHTYRVEYLQDASGVAISEITESITWPTNQKHTISAEILEYYLAPGSVGYFGIGRSSYGGPHLHAADGKLGRKVYVYDDTDINPIGALAVRATVNDLIKAGSYMVFRFVQAELNRAYATSWVPGGTTRAAELLTVPTAGVLDQPEWTIDGWVCFPTWLGRNSTELIIVRADTSSPWTYRMLRYIPSAATLDYREYDGSSSQSVQISGLTWHTDGLWHYFALRREGTVATITADNTNKQGTVFGLAYPNTLTLGRVPPSGGSHANALFGPFRISRRARTDQEIAAAYAAGMLEADADTTLLLPFTGPDAQRGARVLYVPAVGF